jgi:transposase
MPRRDARLDADIREQGPARPILAPHRPPRIASPTPQNHAENQNSRTFPRNFFSSLLKLSLLKRQNGQRLEQIDRPIATVEAATLQIVEADESPADRFAILISIPGVSNITAFALLTAMPELGSLEAGQAANLAGLAPIARQSGRWTSRSFIRGGRADVRQALYIPASSPLASIQT